jgi:LPXTG-motif cell wall-anchored protein
VIGRTINKDDASELTSDENGFFTVIGLDDAKYYLEETKAPDGYNLMTDVVELDLQATTTNGQNWTDGIASSALTALKLDVTVNGETTTANGNLSEGSVATSVLNNKGAELPETGGMGTTLFYLVGAILVIGATVVMVTRKRMGK